MILLVIIRYVYSSIYNWQYFWNYFEGSIFDGSLFEGVFLKGTVIGFYGIESSGSYSNKYVHMHYTKLSRLVLSIIFFYYREKYSNRKAIRKVNNHFHKKFISSVKKYIKEAYEENLLNKSFGNEVINEESNSDEDNIYLTEIKFSSYLRLMRIVWTVYGE